MKKTVKIVGISLGVAVLLFLSLPFFMGDKSANKKQGETTQQATPQIFTSNPLTELVNRIASVFTKKGSAHPGANAAQNTNENALAGNEEMLADARGAAGSPLTEETPQAGGGEGGGLLFGDYEDEWVLAPQVAPEGTFRGMHEISAKGDAYDNYVRAERAARFTPVAINPQTKRVPDSKLARIFNPIKRFFGFDDPYSLEDTDWTDEEAARLAYARGERESAKNPRQFKRAGAPDMNMPNISYDGNNGTNMEENADSENENEILSKVLSLLYPEEKYEGNIQRIIEERFGPPPYTPEKQQAIQKFTGEERAFIRQTMQSVKQETLAVQQGKEEPKNATPSLIETLACGENKSLKSHNSVGCDTSKKIPNPVDEKKKEEVRLENAKKYPEFDNGKNYRIPVTVVYGQEMNIKQFSQGLQNELVFGEELQNDPDPEVQENYLAMQSGFVAQQMYQFMVSKANCEKNSCFWVAATDQPDHFLKESVDMAGNVVFKGDPLNRYAKIREEYIQTLPEKLTELGRTPEQIQQEIEFAQNFSPAYVAYTQEDLQAWARQNREMARDKNTATETTLAYTATAKTGATLIDLGLSPAIGKNAVAISESSEGKPISSIDRAKEISNDISYNLTLRKQAHEALEQHFGKEELRAKMESSFKRGTSTPDELKGDKENADNLRESRTDVGTYQRN